MHSGVVRLPISLEGFSILRQPHFEGTAIDANLSTSPSALPFTSYRHPSILSLISLSPFLLFYLTLLFPPCHYLSTPSTCPTVDVVISHFDVPLHALAEHIKLLKSFPLLSAAGVATRVQVYHKGPLSEETLWEGLKAAMKREDGDAVVLLPNYGREGSTYLHQILSRLDNSYPSSSPSSPVPRGGPLPHLADHTLFMQDHLAWDALAFRRLNSALAPSTSFISLGAYFSTLCGTDSRNTGTYDGVPTVQAIVEGKEEEGRQCKGEEEERRAATWEGQFVVSREAVMSNEKKVYERLLELIEVCGFLLTFSFPVLF
jgi:hypothetical protein